MSNNIKYTGLTAAEVEASRSRFGRNVITPAARRSWFKTFLLKFTDPMIVILLVAGLLSVGVSYYEYSTAEVASFNVFFEPIGIFVAILLATTLSFIFEYKAAKEFNILNQINDEEPVTVIRAGIVSQVPRSEIVVGDIVIFNTGEEIPADGRLLEAASLGVDESSLTGEPMAHKSIGHTHDDPEATYPPDVVLKGTKVMEGNGIMEVTAVGDATESGKVIIESGIENGDPTPLDHQLARLGRVITRFAYFAALIVVAGRLLLYFLETPRFEWIDFVSYLLHTGMIAVALLVMAVPEGLPMAVTLSLAYSMRRLLHSNNLVRKLNACETMGAATVICTDKTGTLTQNRMQVQAALFASGAGEATPGSDAVLPPCPAGLAEAIAVNSTANLDLTDPAHPLPIGNPTEAALLLWLAASGFDYRHLREGAFVIATLPFSTERKYMATVVKSPDTGRLRLFVKGAPEIVMSMCGSFAHGLDRDMVESRLADYQRHAMRTLAFASATLPADAEVPISEGKFNPTGLCLDGVAGISDPVREDVFDAISRCRRAGIEVKIVTGDNPATAVEIARQIGLWTDTDTDENIITGPELAALTDAELALRVQKLKIIARARPLDKKRLVEALRASGHVVAVTGDGTNDAPALKTADIGLSMGDGTAVAKQASDITILDNSFVSIASAVMWGRSLHRNIRRFLLFQLTVNVVACLVVMVGSFFGTDSPLTVTQMLWVNLIMDTFAAVALSTLPPSESVMREKPRRRTDPIINRGMWRFIFGSGIWMAFALLVLLFLFMNKTGAGLSTEEQTVFFTAFVLMQFWNLFNAKAFHSHRGPFDLKGCTEFAIISAVIFLGQVLIVSFGESFFSVCPIPFPTWMLLVLSSFAVVIVPLEACRRIYINKIDRHHTPEQ